MFESHIAFGINLLALVAAAALLGFSAKTESCCKSLMKTIAYLALLLAGLNLLCSTYYTVKYWKEGYFKTPCGQHAPMMMNGQGGMMNSDMMKMMNGMSGQGNMPNSNQMLNNNTSDQSHVVHHPDQIK